MYEPMSLRLVGFCGFSLLLAACCNDRPRSLEASDAGLSRRLAARSSIVTARRQVAPPALRPAPALEITKVWRQQRFAWRQIDIVNWQAVADDLPPLPAEPPLDPSGCPAGMIEVTGNYLVDARGRDDTDGVFLLQNQSCSFWRTRNRTDAGLCDRFDRSAWLAASAALPRKPLRFCIDRYEFPNTYGEFPLVGVTFAEAVKHCEKVGKRLCNESEWTFACEGEEGLPYPHGYERDREVCRIDVLSAGPGKDTFSPRTGANTARGLDFAWQGRRSGESPLCKSPFGVLDMTGNVDEWTLSTRRYGRRMILKGGHWGPARQRCRPQTRGHGPAYNRYDSGFRCCTDRAT
jgi:formylglycine-generating enzyme